MSFQIRPEGVKHKGHQRRKSSRGQEFEFASHVAAPKSRGSEEKPLSSDAKVGVAGWLVGAVRSRSLTVFFYALFIYLFIFYVKVV